MQSGGMWSNAECIAAARLLSSLSNLAIHLEALFPVSSYSTYHYLDHDIVLSGQHCECDLPALLR